MRPPSAIRVSALVLMLALPLLAAKPAAARSLEAIKTRGTIALCAHPNALPYSSKAATPPGFQIELAGAIAERLGVALTRNWVVQGTHIRIADCDILLDTIADREAQEETGLSVSKPYQHSGVILAVRGDNDTIKSVEDLGDKRVGVQVSSTAAMMLNGRGVHTVPDLFEDELLSLLAKNAIDAAAVTPTSVEYFNQTHTDKKLRVLDAFAGEAALNWNVGVGMYRPDTELRAAIDAAMDQIKADGTMKTIYAHYGIEMRDPK